MARRNRHPIKCTECSWKGARRVNPMTNAMGGGACPCCGANARFLVFIDTRLESNNRVYKDEFGASLEESRKRAIKETEEYLRILKKGA